MYTRPILRNKIKRRIRSITPGNTAASEATRGSKFGDEAINDAINSGRAMLSMLIDSAEVWSTQKKYFTTCEDIPDCELDTDVWLIKNVYWDVNADGTLKETSVLATELLSAAQEEAVISDPMDVPSQTNPKYRLSNSAVRLIVSTDRTIPGSKYVLIEYQGDLADLNNDGVSSGIPNILDNIVVEYAVYLLMLPVHPEIASFALQNTYKMADDINNSTRRK